MNSAYKIIEARWEAFGDKQFFELNTSPIVGDLEAAKAVAAAYLTKHTATNYPELIWLAGISDKNGPVHYANHPFITFRVRQ